MYQFSFSNTIYSKKDVSEARQAFQNYLSVRTTPLDRNRVSIEIRVKPEYKGHEREVILEFKKFLLDTTSNHYL